MRWGLYPDLQINFEIFVLPDHSAQEYGGWGGTVGWVAPGPRRFCRSLRSMSYPSHNMPDPCFASMTAGGY
eukprot:746069-Hanusia_phi.AAC.3